MPSQVRRATLLVIASFILPALVAAPAAEAALTARLKDIARIREVRPNQLHGVGLVIGLAGSGDGGELAKQLAANMLDTKHVSIDAGDLNADNIAAVIVTAEVPPFLSEGSRLDVLISCVGKATSLTGGTLLQTTLEGADGVVYAVAQGPVSTGGFAASGEAGSVTKNHVTVGLIPGGAIMEKRIPISLRPADDVFLVLHRPDFATAVRAADAINALFPDAAIAVHAGTVQVHVPLEYRSAERLALFISQLHEVKVVPDTRACVVVNERTGTIVAGEHVKLNTVAIAHGNLTISIKETTDTSQPPPFSPGETRTEKTTEIDVQEDRAGLHVVQDAATLAEVVRALNLLGVTPRDMVSIFQALKEAGALQAELKII